MAATEIEIYVRDLDEARLLAWLDATCGEAREAWRNEGQTGFETARGPVIVTHRMKDGPFDGIAFPWGRALWATDADCARQAALDLDRTVRCDPGSDYPKATEDHALEIEGGTERIVLLLDDAPFAERVVAEVPALQWTFDVHRKNNFGELLPHVFFGDVTRFVVSGFSDRPAQRADAEKILALLESAMGSPDLDVRNLVSVSFCENLIGEKLLEAIRSAMGPRLRAELAKYEGRVSDVVMSEPGSPEHRQWCLARLQHALQRLALDPREQIATIPPFVVVADELALDLDHWSEVCRAWQYVEGEVVERLAEIDALLAGMSEPEQAGRWTPEALACDPGWQRARDMARDALRVAGWLRDVPPTQ